MNQFGALLWRQGEAERQPVPFSDPLIADFAAVMAKENEA